MTEFTIHHEHTVPPEVGPALAHLPLDDAFTARAWDA